MAPPQTRFTYVLMYGTKPIYVLARAGPPHLSALSQTALEIQMSVFLGTNVSTGKLTADSPRYKFVWPKDYTSKPDYPIIAKLNRKKIATFRLFCDIECDIVERFSS